MQQEKIDVRICSNRLLTLHRDELSEEIVYAVRCSSAPLSQADLEWPEHQIFLEFVDTVTDRMDAFQPKQAERIAAFVRDVPEGALLFFCCDAGVSRSSALAAACLRSRGRIREEMEIWSDPAYHPNSLVYKLQCRAYGVHVTGFDLKRHMQINEQAFSNAIRHSRSGDHPLREILNKIRNFLSGQK